MSMVCSQFQTHRDAAESGRPALNWREAVRPDAQNRLARLGFPGLPLGPVLLHAYPDSLLLSGGHLRASSCLCQLWLPRRATSAKGHFLRPRRWAKAWERAEQGFPLCIDLGQPHARTPQGEGFHVNDLHSILQANGPKSIGSGMRRQWLNVQQLAGCVVAQHGNNLGEYTSTVLSGQVRDEVDGQGNSLPNAPMWQPHIGR